MPSNNFIAPITYFLEEGKPNLRECLSVTFKAARQHSISKVIIFTAYGDGVRVAAEEFLKQEEFSSIQIVAVTFPNGKKFTNEKNEPVVVGITPENRAILAKHEIPVVRAHMPFDPIRPQFSEHGLLSQNLSLVGSALNVFGGSMSLCIQAVTMACDAGYIDIGDHVISMTSDTAILARATCTSRLLQEFIVREVLCKPAVLTILRKEDREMVHEAEIEQNPAPQIIDAPVKTKRLTSHSKKKQK